MQFVPSAQAERKPEDESKLCERCGKLFEPRNGNGGKPQRFCSTDCRLAFHSEGQRNANVAQRRPTCSASAQLPAIDPPAPKPSADTPEAKDFDWNDTESVVLHEQPETACYFNPNGALVVRQRSWPDDDSCVLIAPEQIDVFIDKLTDIIGIPCVGKS